MGLSPHERVVLAVPQEARRQRVHEPRVGPVRRARLRRRNLLCALALLFRAHYPHSFVRCLISQKMALRAGVKGTYCKFESEWWSYCAPKKTTTSHCKPSKTPAKTTYYPTTKPYHGYPTHTHKPTPYPTVINKPEELRLSPDWDIYAPPQEREYWFEISEMPGAIDGCECVFHRCRFFLYLFL